MEVNVRQEGDTMQCLICRLILITSVGQEVVKVYGNGNGFYSRRSYKILQDCTGLGIYCLIQYLFYLILFTFIERRVMLINIFFFHGRIYICVNIFSVNIRVYQFVIDTKLCLNHFNELQCFSFGTRPGLRKYIQARKMQSSPKKISFSFPPRD